MTKFKITIPVTYTMCFDDDMSEAGVVYEVEQALLQDGLKLENLDWTVQGDILVTRE